MLEISWCSLHTGTGDKMIKGITLFFVVLLLYLCSVSVHCQTTANTTDTTGSPTDLAADTIFNETDVDNFTSIAVEIPAWSRCLEESADNKTSDDPMMPIVISWCRIYKKVIPCLKKGIPLQAEDNPLDFFISMSFNPVTLKKRSRSICRQLPVVHERIVCAVNRSLADAEICTQRFSSSLRPIYDAYMYDGVTKKELKSLICALTRDTTRCLGATLPSCDQRTKQFLLSYYALFTAKKCIYKPTDPAVNEMAQQFVTTQCAKESSKLAKMKGPAPTEKYDQVVRGMRADCQTFEARFKCYERELKVPEHFWDRWLKHTFHLQNAIDGHREMCPRIEDIIQQLSPDCFNQSQPGVMKCENNFTVSADKIRIMEIEKNLTDAQMAEKACSCTLQKAACYKEAFTPCSVDLAEVMSRNIISMLSKECRESDTSSPGLTDTKALDGTKAISDSATVAADGKLTGSSGPKDGAAVNKASNLFYLLLMTVAYHIT